jgi:hypothetical protein
MVVAQTAPREHGVCDDLRTLAGVRIFFGHHSVGRDILDGVRHIAAHLQCRVGVESAPLAENGDPLGKIADFEMHAVRGACDVAVMKLCYADFCPDTNIDALVDAYSRSVSRIRAARPGIVIVHTTPPLHSRQIDLRARVNRTLGRIVWEDGANKKRLELGEELRAAFPRDPFFDIGRVESTKPDGTRELHPVDDRLVPMLWPGYTIDGGHLNMLGRRVAARAFVHALANAVR